MSHELKFLEAYLPELKAKKSLYELIEMYRSNRQYFITDIKNQLYCPECHQAQLSFVENSTIYLRTKKNAQHATSCLLNVPTMDKKEVSEFKKHPDEKIINHQKQSILNRLLDKKTDISKSKHIVFPQEDNFIEKKYTNSQHTKIKKRLSERRIDVSLSDEDFGLFKFFYGKVIIQIRCHNNQYGEFYIINIYTVGSHKYICSLSMNSNVYYYFNQNHHFNEHQEYTCALVFATELQQNTSKDGKHTFTNGKISHSNLIDAVEL